MAPIGSLTVSPVRGVLLNVEGDSMAVRHLAAEYADPAAEDPSPGPSQRLDVQFVSRLPGAHADGHKTVNWAAALERPKPGHLVLRVALRGRPRSFGLSLVQGYLIEPALSLLGVDAGGVLLPAAGIIRDGEALVLVGRSGTGKSSLSLRAMAAGLPLLGDDQVFVAADGTCIRFPRRLRLYDDAFRTAPRAIARLPGRDRLMLRMRRVIRIVSLGFIAPSQRVPISSFPGAVTGASAPIGQVALLEPSSSVAAVTSREADLEFAVDRAAAALVEQRRRLRPVLSGPLADELGDLEARERASLRQALAHASITGIDLPAQGDAVAAIDGLASELGLPSGDAERERPNRGR